MSEKRPVRRIVSSVPLLSKAEECERLLGRIFARMDDIASAVMDELAEMREEDRRHHKALERRFLIVDEEAEGDDEDEDVGDELAKELVQ